MSWSIGLSFTLDRVLIAAAVVPTVAVISYGATVAIGSGGSIEQQLVTDTRLVNDRQFVLQYADAQKAMFKTDEGISLVMVGSPLDAAGRIESIKQVDGHWTVTTSKGVTFVTN